MDFSTSNTITTITPPTFTITILGGATGTTVLSSFPSSAPLASWSSGTQGYFSVPLVATSAVNGTQIILVKLQSVSVGGGANFAVCMSTSQLIAMYNS